VRLVLDTNTAISGLLWHGTPGKLVDAARVKSVMLCTSAILLAELRGVLMRVKFAKQLETRGLNAIVVAGVKPRLFAAAIVRIQA